MLYMCIYRWQWGKGGRLTKRVCMHVIYVYIQVAMREGWEVDEASLLRYRRNVFSEAGEDGIVRHIVERAAIGQGVCVCVCM
jgi:hypothetical protein